RTFGAMAGRRLRPAAYIAADSPYCTWLTERCGALGVAVAMSFNCNYDELVPAARGSTLIVTCVGERLVFPTKYVASHLPVGRAVRRGGRGRPTRRARRGANRPPRATSPRRRGGSRRRASGGRAARGAALPSARGKGRTRRDARSSTRGRPRRARSRAGRGCA